MPIAKAAGLAGALACRPVRVRLPLHGPRADAAPARIVVAPAAIAADDLAPARLEVVVVANLLGAAGAVGKYRAVAPGAVGRVFGSAVGRGQQQQCRGARRDRKWHSWHAGLRWRRVAAL